MTTQINGELTFREINRGIVIYYEEYRVVVYKISDIRHLSVLYHKQKVITHERGIDEVELIFLCFKKIRDEDNKRSSE
jgi:hypothetical protein